MRLRPKALETLGRALVALSSNRPQETAVLSVQPYHRTGTVWERPALLFNTLVFIGSARRSAGLWLTMGGNCCFGPCILCSRKEYLLFGGHSPAPPYIGLTAIAGMVPGLVVATVFYTFFVLQIAAAGARLGFFGPVWAFFFPIHLAVFLFVFSRSAEELHFFVAETRRAELAHWLPVIGFLGNVPFIMVQRHLRPRLAALEERRRR